MKIKLCRNILAWSILLLFIFACYGFARESSRSSGGRSSGGRSAGGRSAGGRSSGGDSSASALKAGDQAILFKSVDENMNPVDMADMINGKPLVLLTGSCT